MTFDAIVHSIPAWLGAEGPESTIVISSRTRLARNVKGVLYAHRADDGALGDIVRQVLDAAPAAGFSGSDFFINSTLSDTRKHVFIERHLISRALAARSGNRGVLVRKGEDASVLINEEDHLRMQAFAGGFDPMAALQAVNELHDRFAQSIEFSFSEEVGYLTACPTNMGSGLRASVLIHLPALVLTGEVQRVIRSASQLGLAIRGYHGEGSDVVGNLFQISNQRSLGGTGEEIVVSLVQLVNQIIEYESRAADTMLEEARSRTEDKIWRSLGILKTARMLSTGEFMDLSSAVRLGVRLGFVDRRYLPVLNELLVLTQPAHVQEMTGAESSPHDRDNARAALVRERFVDVTL